MAKLEAKVDVELNLEPIEYECRALARIFWEAADRIERIRKGFGEATMEEITATDRAIQAFAEWQALPWYWRLVEWLRP